MHTACMHTACMHSGEPNRQRALGCRAVMFLKLNLPLRSTLSRLIRASAIGRKIRPFVVRQIRGSTMAAVVDDCGSNGFHEYACILDAKHEGKHVKVNPTQCAPRLTRPLPAAHRPELSSEGLAPLSCFARFVARNSHTQVLPAGLREYTNGEKSALNAWRCARMRLGRRCAHSNCQLPFPSH